MSPTFHVNISVYSSSEASMYFMKQTNCWSLFWQLLAQSKLGHLFF